MKAKKKHRGIKQKIREEKKRERRIALDITAAILITVVSISGFAINSILNQPSTNQTVSITSQLKAAIVDQGSLSPTAGPNPFFIETATNILKQAGYTVDYYKGEEVTVNFYRNLATHGYRLIVLRVHSALGPNRESPVVFFTSEPYSKTKYVHEQLTGQVIRVGILTDDEEYEHYLAITPKFITSRMNGRFNNTIILMMGCNGLTYTSMAQAFIEKGAKTYISWNQPVLVSHTDSATVHLLRHFLIEKRTLKKSVQETFKEVGFDPVYNSSLLYYPLEAGDYVIPVSLSNLAMNSSKYESG